MRPLQPRSEDDTQPPLPLTRLDIEVDGLAFLWDDSEVLLKELTLTMQSVDPTTLTVVGWDNDPGWVERLRCRLGDAPPMKLRTIPRVGASNALSCLGIGRLVTSSEACPGGPGVLTQLVSPVRLVTLRVEPVVPGNPQSFFPSCSSSECVVPDRRMNDPDEDPEFQKIVMDRLKDLGYL